MASEMTGRTLAGAAASVAVAAAVSASYLAWLPDLSGLGAGPPRATPYVGLYVRRCLSRGVNPEVRMNWVPLDRISKNLQFATLIAEDDRFYTHHGIDWEELREAVNYNLRRRRLARGASTITQQVARNLFLKPEVRPMRKLSRKLSEILIARHIERSLDKGRILEIYLNVVEWGEGVFGAEAASRKYFGKSAADLDAGEAVRLVVALPSPYRWNPEHPLEADLQRKMASYLERMRKEGLVPP
jgi:monofunctional biosynthetic peptidoglycan transglycosylase